MEIHIKAERAKEYLNAEEFAKAVPLLQEVAEAGRADSMLTLGILYATDNSSIPRDIERAYYWLKRTVQSGNEEYAKIAAERLETLDAVKAAEQQEAAKRKAQNQSVQNYERGVAELESKDYKDYHNANEYLSEAANAGNVKAMVKLGFMLISDMGEWNEDINSIYRSRWPNAENPAAREGLNWLDKAAKLGHEEAIRYFKEQAQLVEAKQRQAEEDRKRSAEARQRAAAQKQTPQLSAEHKRFQAEMAKSKERYDKEQRERAAKEKRDNESAEATRRSEQAHQARVWRNTYGDNH
jgi:TPR repeat protein